MVHLPPFALVTQSIHLAGAIGTTSFAKNQWQAIQGGAKEFVTLRLCKDTAEVLGKTNALLFINPIKTNPFPFKTMGANKLALKPFKIMPTTNRPDFGTGFGPGRIS